MNSINFIVYFISGIALVYSYIFFVSLQNSFIEEVELSLDQEEKKLSEALKNSNIYEDSFFPLEYGEIIKVDADALCEWQKTTSDKINIENSNRWDSDPPYDYGMILKSNNDGYCLDGQKPDKVYALIKISIPNYVETKSLNLILSNNKEEFNFRVTAIRKNDSLKFITHTTRGQNKTEIVDPSKNLRFFNYKTKFEDGKIVSYSRLVVSAVSVREDWRLSGFLYTGKEKIKLPIVNIKPRLRSEFKSVVSGILSPCMSISSINGEFDEINSFCSIKKSFMKEITKNIISVPEEVYYRKASVMGIPVIIKTYGDNVISVSSIKVINAILFLSMLILFVIILLLFSWQASKSLSMKVRKIVESIRAARKSPSENPDIPYILDKELGELALAAREWIISEINLERSRAKIEIDQKIEKERARAHEDYAYCLRHELRNFVAAVIATADPELQDRARLASSLISSMDEIASRKPLTSLDTEQETSIISVGKLISGWRRSQSLQILNEDDSVINFKDINVRCITSLVYQVLDKYLENAIEHRMPKDSDIKLIVADCDGFVGIAIVNHQEELDSERAERLFRPSNTLQGLEGQERLRGVGLYAAREYALSTGGFVAAIVKYPFVEFWIHLQRSEYQNFRNT